MKKSKKKLRGMTLVEVIIAILVFALLGMVLMGVGNATDAHQRSARKYNQKVNDEGPIAEAQHDANAILINKDYEIEVGQSGGKTVKVSGKMYSVEKPKLDDSGNIVYDSNGNVVPDPDNDSGHFKFIEIQKPTEAATAAPTTTGPTT
ncbi:MAG: prepilin-type N-terminal cleavage/methylation domain-containing protein [Ruminococcus sp.]|nr:prepilin-type N-terminal cleavage/methylation domain-containing protein [Ruminococcus sp.]